MNAQMEATQILTIGALVEGGFLAGRIKVGGEEHGLVVAPKAEGEFKDSIWIARYKDVPGAGRFSDGASNTAAMAEAGSKLAQKAIALTIGAYTDWYLPAIDELEICYRAFKPTTDENSLYARSGINVTAVPPTYPYTVDIPAQTALEAFRAGGAEAYEATYYWSSTQHAGYSDDAWAQYFHDGSQDNYGKDDDFRARAVRRFKL